ncbi:MAG: molybdopterin-dependent oxidoreductase, partial [Candidatus Binataceae bacterium]
VRELGLVRGADDGLGELLRAIETGEVKGLYVCGSDLLAVAARERLAALIPKLELLILQDLKIDPIFAGARIFFPTTTFAEKEGTFTNHAGRVQRIQKAITPPSGWLDDGEIFTALLNLLDSRREEFALPRIWAAMERDGSPFARLNFAEIGPHGTLLEGESTTAEEA